VIDKWNDTRTGWARFSEDRVMRYRLARSLVDAPLIVGGDEVYGIARVVWLLLNPSTADAFEPDPTVTECHKRSAALGADTFEVINLFAFRSPYPVDLKKRAHGFRGDDATNNEQILAACRDAYRVIAAWGNDGAIANRDVVVRSMLRSEGVKLWHLGLTQGGFPKHPLARGVHRIPAGLMPQEWNA
jgi:hypothetical protein